MAKTLGVRSWFFFSSLQREQGVSAAQDFLELNNVGEEQSGETSVPARGTGGNVFDLYQFINEYK